MEIPEPEEYQAWLEDPTTQVFRKALRKWREGLKNQWAKGQFQSENIEATALMSVGAQAKVALLGEILEMTYLEIEEIFEEEEEDE